MAVIRFLFIFLTICPLFAKMPVKMTKESENTFCYQPSSNGAKSCFVDVGDFLIVVDSGYSEPFAKTVYADVVKRSGKKAGLLIHTRAHRTHSRGGAFYRKKGVAEWNGFVSKSNPSAEFIEQNRTIKTAHGDIRIISMAAGSLAVFDVTSGVLFTGDFSDGQRAFVMSDANITAAAQTIAALRSLHPHVVVGGHESFIGDDGFAKAQSYLAAIKCSIEEGACLNGGRIAPKRAALRCSMRLEEKNDVKGFMEACKAWSASKN